MRVHLVRHGQTVWNRELVFRGRADVPLDQRGMEQAACAGEALSKVKLAAIHSSPLSRARQTAEVIARHHRLAVRIDDAFVDFDCGAFQGKTVAEAKQAYPEVFEMWEKRPHLTRFPDGGSLDDVAAAVMPRLRELSGQYASEDIAIVTHRVALKVILCQVRWGSHERFWDVTLDTASISVIEGDADGFCVLSQNRTSHLAALDDGQTKVDF